MKLTLGFSPCPNDTFMFDALVHDKVDTEGLKFEIVMEDVEALNQRALQQRVRCDEAELPRFLHCVQDYSLLNSGSALGRNCGPLLIQKKEMLHLQLIQKLLFQEKIQPLIYC